MAQITKFQNLTMADGISSSSVYCIAQDNYGFIWLGTEKGLNIYDGIQFRKFAFEPGNSNTIPGNRVENIIIDT